MAQRTVALYDGKYIGVETIYHKTRVNFFSREKMYAIRYWRECVNIIIDKVMILEGNSSGIRILNVVDRQIK
jgi:hypothetical protein